MDNGRESPHHQKKRKPPFEEYIRCLVEKLTGPLERLANRLKHELNQTPVNLKAVQILNAVIALVAAARNVAAGRVDPYLYLHLLELTPGELKAACEHAGGTVTQKSVPASELVTISAEASKTTSREDHGQISLKTDRPKPSFNFFGSGRNKPQNPRSYKFTDPQRLAVQMALDLNGKEWPGSYTKMARAINADLADSKEANTYGHAYLAQALEKIRKVIEENVDVVGFAEDDKIVYLAIAQKFQSWQEIEQLVESR